ncbi:MAG: hypothetical protein KGL39_29405 [Patescibacteria group bacterium]|nr:hypothetical protein [Patescibacteria group bacterium]
MPLYNPLNGNELRSLILSEVGRLMDGYADIFRQHHTFPMVEATVTISLRHLNPLAIRSGDARQLTTSERTLETKVGPRGDEGGSERLGSGEEATKTTLISARRLGTDDAPPDLIRDELSGTVPPPPLTDSLPPLTPETVTADTPLPSLARSSQDSLAKVAVANAKAPAKGDDPRLAPREAPLTPQEMLNRVAELQRADAENRRNHRTARSVEVGPAAATRVDLPGAGAGKRN